MEVTQALMRNYLPYAKAVIIGRAIPAIDGLKPSQRKILYTMYKMHLLNGNKTKSTNIVGQTMRYHPHGDQSIYATMVNLTTGNEGLNCPYIESKGNFGKVYSRDLAYAASRYTEAKLAKICEEMFDGIDEDAVEFVPNYDDTLMEPTLLPVKFPTILVNPSNGIAVGMGSSIPSFGINNVCKSVIGILKGTITDEYSLVATLGIPEFTTGGNVHIDQKGMANFAKTGHGSILMTGRASLYSDRIEITELPYKVYAESILSDIEELVKTDVIKSIADVKDNTDITGFRITVTLKRGANPAQVLKKLMQLTQLRTSIGFNVRVIIDNECKELGLLNLLHEWISFRINCLNRIYSFRVKKEGDREHLLSAWEKLKIDIRKVASTIANKSESEAKVALMTDYSLDDAQAEYILDMKIKEFTQDRLNKHLNELAESRKNLAEYQKILNSDAEKYKIIIKDQERIIQNYGKTNKTHLGPVIDLEKERQEDNVVEIDDSDAVVVMTKSGYLKRLTTIGEITNYQLPEGEEEQARFSVKNNQHLIVFTYDGCAYKIAVNSIDTGRGKLKDLVHEMIGVNKKEIMLVDAAGDYTKHFNLVYPNGRGYMVYYSHVSGKRSKYKSLFDPCTPGAAWYTFEDKFFMVTRRRKAAYCNLINLTNRSRSAFKVARISSGDSILMLWPEKNVPNIEEIDLNKYNRDYTVLVGADDLWPGARQKYMEDQLDKLTAKKGNEEDKNVEQ